VPVAATDLSQLLEWYASGHMQRCFHEVIRFVGSVAILICWVRFYLAARRM
jgi:hypothetical protein